MDTNQWCPEASRLQYLDEWYKLELVSDQILMFTVSVSRSDTPPERCPIRQLHRAQLCKAVDGAGWVQKKSIFVLNLNFTVHQVSWVQASMSRMGLPFPSGVV